MKSNQKNENQNSKKNPVGRPTDYEERFNDMAYVACVEGGFTDLKLAKLFDVSEVTINAWKKAYPEFLKSLKKGKDLFDTEVAEKSLMKRVKGYTYTETTRKPCTVKDKDGEIISSGMKITKQVKKHVPSDTTSIIFFLKNRAPGRWRDSKNIEYTGKDGGPIRYDAESAIEEMKKRGIPIPEIN